ncbi:uncharacterized protein [Rutidosis leptorrhynchoides]|uniref:uncharacterized protein n=1 Tax=Rutidosis leptorrhynchoides TaxID=125765 RepID=UPI003A99E44E
MQNESAFYDFSNLNLNKDRNVVGPNETQTKNGTVKMLPSGYTGPNNGGMMSQFSSASTSSFSPSRYQPEGEYDPQFNVSGNSHGLVPMSGNQVIVDPRDQEQEILLLRKHIADYSIKEAQIHNEKFALEKRIAYMR